MPKKHTRDQATKKGDNLISSWWFSRAQWLKETNGEEWIEKEQQWQPTVTKNYAIGTHSMDIIFI